MASACFEPVMLTLALARGSAGFYAFITLYLARIVRLTVVPHMSTAVLLVLLRRHLPGVHYISS